MLAEELNVDSSTVSRNLKQKEMSKELDKWLLQELRENKKKRRFEVCSPLPLQNKNNCNVQCKMDFLRQSSTIG